MDVGVIDASATSGTSGLHRASPIAKLIAFALVLGAAVSSWNLLVIAGLALALAGVAVAARLPLRAAFSLAAYPALFAAIFAFASAPDPFTAATIVLKAVTAALAAVIVVFTTPYPQVFAPLQRITPPLVGDAMLMTYRALFLLLAEFSDLLRAVRLRSGLSRGHPVRAARATTSALGGLLLYSFDLAQREYDVMYLRGYSDRLHVTLPRTDSRARDAAMIAAAAAALVVAASWRIYSVRLNPYSWMATAAGAGLLVVGIISSRIRRS